MFQNHEQIRFWGFESLLLPMSLSQGSLLPPSLHQSHLAVPVPFCLCVTHFYCPPRPAPTPRSVPAHKGSGVNVWEMAGGSCPFGSHASPPTPKVQRSSWLSSGGHPGRRGRGVIPARPSPTAPGSLTCTPDANGRLCHRETHRAHAGHLLTAAMVTGEVAAVLSAGSVRF